jgi:hypothetical protein
VIGLATRLARVVGLTVLLYSGVVFLGNLLGAMARADYNSLEILVLIVGVGAVGLVGSIVFLLSLDGPESWRTTTRRALGWIGMMIAAVLPTSWLYLIATVTLLGGLALHPSRCACRGRRTSGSQLRVMSLAATRGPKLGS